MNAGVQKDMMLHALCITSVDNVDRDMPWKRNSCEYGFHGNSIQHVNPRTVREGMKHLSVRVFSVSV